jgi:hypothetical protein
MNNPLQILRTLDRHLTKPAELTIFGRAALALGFPNSPAELGSTHDVDAIMPVELGEPNEDFWLAQQATNEELEAKELYITHLFSELDVILRPIWKEKRTALDLSLSRLRIYRPSTIDLILTKMARGDDEDLQDIQFLLRQGKHSATELKQAFAEARVPRVPEIQELFRAAQPRVLAMIEATT